MSDDWIKAAEALAIVTKVIPREQAIDTIIDGAYSGQIKSRASLYISIGSSDLAEFEMSRDFWHHIPKKSTVQNWATGDFTEFERAEGFQPDRALGVRFGRADIAECLLSLVVDSQNPGEPENLASKGGRHIDRSLWDDWTIELIMYFFEKGYPAGTGNVGRSLVRDAVDNQLALAGKRGPSRNSVDTIIQGVLDRIRSAKN